MKEGLVEETRAKCRTIKMAFTSLVILLVLFLLSIVFLFKKRYGRKGKGAIPGIINTNCASLRADSTVPNILGPRCFPLLGNLPQLASARASSAGVTFLGLHRLSLEYGPLMELWLGPRKRVVVVSGKEELKVGSSD